MGPSPRMQRILNPSKQCFSMTQASDVLCQAFAAGATRVYVAGEPFPTELPVALESQLQLPGLEPRRGNLRGFLDQMRAVKSASEVGVMQTAADVSASAFASAMAATQPGLGEHEIDAGLEWAVRRAGASRLAYPAVVAGGARALTLHYVDNNQVM